MVRKYTRFFRHQRKLAQTIDWLFISVIAGTISFKALPAYPWSSKDHEIIAAIAEAHVTSAASGIAVFRGEIAKLGYIEAGNIVIEYRSADNRLDRLPALAEEMARIKVNVLVTPAVNEAVAVTNITKIIPIVFAGVLSRRVNGLFRAVFEEPEK